jgi:OOP family OmpA-OmpF porin
MNMKFAAAAASGLLALGAVAPQAAAADNGFYLGAGITETNFDVEIAGLSEDFDDNGFKLIAGWRPFNWFAVEANYIDLGGYEDDDVGLEVDSSAITLSALVLAEIGIVDLYARAGMANWDTEFSIPAGSVSDDGWEPTYGVGVGVHFGSIGVRAEYERFSTEALDDDLDTDTDILSVSVTYTFL